MHSELPSQSADHLEQAWFAQLRFGEQGLLAAIAQDVHTGRVL
ncbi:MAG: hypothetical protein RL539_1647, partial [Pseudomonadota bacterium]